MVGSEDSIGSPNTTLNAIVAEALLRRQTVWKVRKISIWQSMI